MKTLIGAILVLVLLIGGYFVYMTRDGVNERVANEIATEPNGERAAKTMVVTLADGRVYPVNYLLEGRQVFMGIDGRWWTAFEGAGQPIAMLIRGENFCGHARAVLDRPDYKREIFARLRPRAPSWLPDWLNGKLVVIDLDESGDC